MAHIIIIIIHNHTHGCMFESGGKTFLSLVDECQPSLSRNIIFIFSLVSRHQFFFHLLFSLVISLSDEIFSACKHICMKMYRMSLSLSTRSHKSISSSINFVAQIDHFVSSHISLANTLLILESTRMGIKLNFFNERNSTRKRRKRSRA